MFGLGAQAQAPKPNAYNPNNDIEVQTPADLDGVSSLCFSPTANFLIGTSWNNSVYCWEISQQGQTLPKAQLKDHQQPVLCSCWNADGSQVMTGSCDKTARLWNLATNTSTQVAQHDAPVKHVFFIKEMNLLMTGSWDKTIKFWDLRTQNPVNTQQLPERVYAMDVNYPLAVVGTADRNLIIYNLTNPTTPYKTIQSQLKWQTRCVSCFPDKSGYLVGSIEGRVAVQHVDEAVATKNFTFKCHRDGAEIFAVNSMAFHPVYGTFATAGSDGTYNFWDKDSKQRLKAQAKSMYAANTPAPIPCGTFNRDGSIYAYAVSYDWSKGYSEYNPAIMKNCILLHPTKDEEVKSKPKTAPLGGAIGGRK